MSWGHCIYEATTGLLPEALHPRPHVQKPAYSCLDAIYTRQATLKINIVSGPAAGVYISAEWKLFFSFSHAPPPPPPKKKKCWSKFHHFLNKKKGGKKSICGRNFGHPLDRKQFYLRVASYTTPEGQNSE